MFFMQNMKRLLFRDLESNNLEVFADYRTYLDFDIETENKGQPISLSKHGGRSSGGEGQTPFYITILASFAQLYRINDNRISSFRLVVFDEAYSKMDLERIQRSIELIRELGFQSVILSSTEKIPSIAPLANKNLIVTSDNYEAEVFDAGISLER